MAANSVALGQRLRTALGNTSLKTRLLVLVLIAILPSTILLGYIEVHVHAERRAQLSVSVLREAELLNADVLSVVEGARQLTLAISKFPTVEHGDPACRDRLLDLRSSLSFYTNISVFDGGGNLICSTSAAAPSRANLARLAHIRNVIKRNVFDVGEVINDPSGNLPVLPFCLPFRLADGRDGVVIANLSLVWFSRHLGELNRPPGSTIGIADRSRTTVARFPNPDIWIGKPFPKAPARFINAPHRGSVVVTGFDGKPRLVGFVPASEAPLGLFVSIGLFFPDLIADIDRADWFAGGLITCGAILSILLALAIGERFIRRPTEQLLRAARSWSAGDLSTRAPLADSPRSEFGRLATAFNAMAGALGREQERLERTVAERTHELVAANERLKTEIAEREKSEASLLQAQKLQAVGQLAGGIAHDFNNLLGVIIGSLELAVQQTTVVPGFVLRHVNNALNAAGRGAALTKQLLAFSRRQVLSPAALNVNAVIAGMKPLLTSTLGDVIEIVTELDPKLPLALADSSFVESAVLNLAINARD
ncbi:MAG: HAMP domain-containing protein, partial [Acetobacteraceae bacterium]